jgi:hypothetical protein
MFRFVLQIKVVAGTIYEGKVGWGGRIRTSTILINSEVSYRLDHAPAGASCPQHRRREHAIVGGLRRKNSGQEHSKHTMLAKDARIQEKFMASKTNG